MREIVNDSTFLDQSNRAQLNDPDVEENSETKWLKVLIGLRVTVESQSDGLYTSPYTASTREINQGSGTLSILEWRT